RNNSLSRVARVPRRLTPLLQDLADQGPHRIKVETFISPFSQSHISYMGEEEWMIEEPTAIEAIEFHPAGRHIASLVSNYEVHLHEVHLWDLVTGSLAKILKK